MTQQYENVKLDPAEPFHQVHLGTDSSGRALVMNERTIAMLDAADKRLGFDLTIVQGSYQHGHGAAASGTTHDGGGVIDISTSSLSEHDKDQALRVLRETGFAAWYRTPAEGFPYHIHAVAIGDKDLSDSAKAQVNDYYHGFNGLSYGTPDDGPRVPIHVFDYEAAVSGAGDGTAADAFGVPKGHPIAATDHDGDGLTDEFERLLGTNPNRVDSDHDGLTDFEETYQTHTDPLSADTDHDGMTDAVEVQHGTDAGTAALSEKAVAAGFGGAATLDQDHDGLSDLTEAKLGSDPTKADTDHDGVSDGVEHRLGSDLLSIDTDHDGIVDSMEYDQGTLGPAPDPLADGHDPGSDPTLDGLGAAHG